MANFTATLNDTNNELAVTANGTLITITDYSNYTDGTEDGHLQSDFKDFKMIKFDLPDGNTYIMGTGAANQYFNTADQIISDPAAESTFPITDSFAYTTGDGVYEVTLYVVPTWRNDANYVVGQYVYYDIDHKIWKVKAPNIGVAPVFGFDWELVSDIDDLPAKYLFSDHFDVVCDSQICLTRMITKAICESSEIGCSYEKLFKNQYFVNAQKMALILKYITTLAEADQWDAIAECINLLKSICCCNS